MAADKEPISFDDIIQADRQKRKNEALANEILTRNRRPTAPRSTFGNQRQTSAPGNLSSRTGIAKQQRPAPTTFRPKPNSTFHSSPARTPGPFRSASANRRRPHEERFVTAPKLDTDQPTVRNNGIAIKGAGTGPFIVLGSNFAPETTAADIQSALEPVGGEMLSCKVTSEYPTVTAEMIFAERWGAENVVANFDNQRADGRILSMRLRIPSATGTGSQQTPDFNPPTGPQSQSKSRTFQSSYNGQREQADRERRESRRADPQIQDGSYGFDAQDGHPQSHSHQSGRGNPRYPSRREAGYQREDYNGHRGGRSRDPPRHQQQQQRVETGLYSDEIMVDAPALESRSRGRDFR